MLRKTVCAASLILCSSISHAGFYLGASVGPEGAEFRQRSHVIRPGTFDVIDKNHFSGTGVFGSIFGGYQWRYQRYSLAAEVNGNLSSVEYELNNNEYIHQTFLKTTFTVKRSAGVSVLPGYFLSENTLIFGRVGYSNGRVKISESDPTILSQTKNRGGIRYGLGLKHALSTNWWLMLDYSQINYKGIKSAVFEPFGGVLKQTKITPNTAQMGLGIIYDFDQPKAYVK
ncbi:hypothetical protein B1207_13225 [Legionella quinlivanii]|uniref:Outer membrane protein beta-barrel domain-containing protein n=1 Tax=Legionella quinlivanii TaxID=45073 RepID=A0A364LGK4_9GAMM|nr:outer membrane beta-barrel protein [Legionella quinlivanii]RAP35328.1 hypothetical protein B1207_13225 [Legionella quinlivanii]